MTLEPGSGDMDADRRAIAAGAYDFGLDSLHALSPLLADGSLSQAAELATPTGPVPWSAYIAQPERIVEARSAFAAFTRAIARAQAWMDSAPVDEIAALVAPHYQSHPANALTLALDGYRASGVLTEGPVITDTDFDHFARLLRDTGWIRTSPPAAALLDMDLARAAMYAIDGEEA